MNVLVLGAGVIGVTSAYYLAREGHAVTVIDRREGPGLETSFANGGQVSASHAYPWSGPGVPMKILKWLGRADAPLRFSPRLDPDQWAWALAFLRNCTARRFTRNAERNLRLALASREALRALRRETGIAYDEETLGILHFFRDQASLDGVADIAERFRDWGSASRVLDRAGCVEVEPALGARADELVGGLYTPDDESGDARLFTERLADLCTGMGVTFRYNETVTALETGREGITGVRTDRGLQRADAYVVALATASTGLLRPLGIRLPVYPVKGYSVTVPVGAQNGAPRVSLIDEENKVVYSRLGNRLRAAGTAHLAGYDDTVDPVRARAVLDVVRRQFPNAGAFDRTEFWAGLRPMTPDGGPIITRTRFDNLYLNTGHGTLGWTMCCGSAQVLAGLVAGRQTNPDANAYGLR